MNQRKLPAGRVLVRGIFLCAALVLAALPAFPIALQYAPTFTNGVGGFTGLVNLGGCSGALLADGIHVITAAHCAANITTDGVNSTLTPRTNMTAGFFLPSETVAIPIAGVHINPLAAYMFPQDAANFNLLIYDLAVLDLATPAPAAAVGYDIDLSGNATPIQGEVTMAGWGLGGYPGGNVGGAGGRRAATNNILGVFTQSTDPNIPLTILLPDLPIAVFWTPTSDINNPANTTGLPNRGDSGGPLIYNGSLIGVSAFGNLPDSGSPIVIGRTYYAGFTNLSVAGNANFLMEVLAPEPATYAMFFGAAAVFALARRRRVRA